MKLLCLVVLAFVALAAATIEEPPYYDLNQAEQLFEQFIKDFNRQYKDEADKQAHFEAFKESLAIINEANQENSGATFGITNLADFTEEERKHLFGLRPPLLQPESNE